VVITWVNTIALNLYRCLIRREPLDQTLPKLRGKTVGIDLAAIDVARVLTFCRPRDRILLEQYLTGVTTAEIAHQQGVTKTAIRIRLLRARRDARSRVERRTIPARGSDALDIAKCNAA